LHWITTMFVYATAIATEMFFILLQSSTTTCFGPYGPSSGGTQHQLSFYSAINATTDPLFCLDVWWEYSMLILQLFTIWIKINFKNLRSKLN
jgi:hypothetical protein